MPRAKEIRQKKNDTAQTKKQLWEMEQIQWELYLFYKKNKTQVSRQGMKAGMATRSNGKQ